MLCDTRRLDAPELGVFHEQIDLRTPWMRVMINRGRNVTSDFALVDRVSPFVRRVARHGRSAVTFVLRGRGRFDESGAHGWMRAGDFVASDIARLGTEAYSGDETEVMAVEWNTDLLGAAHAGRFVVDRLSPSDHARLQRASVELRGADRTSAVLRIFDLIRSMGFPVQKIDAGALHEELDARDALAVRIHAACNEALSSLTKHPAIDDIVSAFGTNPRQINRIVGALSRRYGLLWEHWRGALHHIRLSHALRLLSAPGATTELVARLTGFRAPTALCHALAKGGLPSPGVLARAARGDALEAWTTFARPPRPDIAA